MFELAGVAEPAGEAQRVMDVETRLAQGHWERAETRDVIKGYNLTTRDELATLAPHFDWAVVRRGPRRATTRCSPRSTCASPATSTHLSAGAG